MERSIYFREWRQKRGLTQQRVVNQLAMHDDPKMPQTTASLSRLEAGKQPYSQRVLEALADIYGCEAWELIGRDPTKEGVVIDLVRLQDERRQAQIMAFIKGLDAADGTNG